MLLGSLRRVAWAAFLAAVFERALKDILGYERGMQASFEMDNYNYNYIANSIFPWPWVLVLIATTKFVSLFLMQ